MNENIILENNNDSANDIIVISKSAAKTLEEAKNDDMFEACADAKKNMPCWNAHDC